MAPSNAAQVPGAAPRLRFVLPFQYLSTSCHWWLRSGAWRGSAGERAENWLAGVITGC